MDALLETLTPAEAALVADVSVRDVNRVIDEQILPDNFYSTRQTRSFRSEACVFISFYFRTADRLTAEERQRTIRTAGRHGLDWTSASNRSVQDDFLTIDLSPFWKSTHDRLRRLSAAREMVSIDSEVLGGTPVIKGTRIPVHDVAASVVAGLPMERILAAYPGLSQEQVKLAALFAEANPQRGRPRHRSSPPAGAVILSSRRKLRGEIRHDEAAH
jgi:uncharacterized protein (DUF433 family)